MPRSLESHPVERDLYGGLYEELVPRGLDGVEDRQEGQAPYCH